MAETDKKISVPITKKGSAKRTSPSKSKTTPKKKSIKQQEHAGLKAEVRSIITIAACLVLILSLYNSEKLDLLVV